MKRNHSFDEALNKLLVEVSSEIHSVKDFNYLLNSAARFIDRCSEQEDDETPNK